MDMVLKEKRKSLYVAPGVEVYVLSPCRLLVTLSVVAGFEDIDFEEPSFEDIGFDTPA